MSNYYRKSTDHKILGYPCLETKHSKDDTILPGKLGAIWEYSPDLYFVMTTSAVLSKRYMPERCWISNGEEAAIVVEEKQARSWIKRLGIRRSLKSQLESPVVAH